MGGPEPHLTKGHPHGQLPDLCLCFSFCLKCFFVSLTLLRPRSNAHFLAPFPRSLYPRSQARRTNCSLCILVTIHPPTTGHNWFSLCLIS